MIQRKSYNQEILIRYIAKKLLYPSSILIFTCFASCTTCDKEIDCKPSESCIDSKDE